MDNLLTNEPYFSIALFVIGVISGALNSMGGSGGLVILTFMIGSGINPALALGTARLANILPLAIAAKKFHKSGHVKKEYLPQLILIAVTAGSLGTIFIINIPEQYVYTIAGILLLIISPLIFFKKDFGLNTVSKNRKSKRLGYFIYFLAMMYGGFFGAGASIFVIYGLVVFFGMKTIEALATEMTAWIVMSVISSLIFIYAGEVAYNYLLIILISMGIGSTIGVHIAVKKGSKLINLFICLFSIVMGLKLLFGN